MQKCVTVNSYSRFTDCRISKIARAPLRSIVSLLLTRPPGPQGPTGCASSRYRYRFSGIASLPLSQMFRQSKANLQLSNPCDQATCHLANRGSTVLPLFSSKPTGLDASCVRAAPFLLSLPEFYICFSKFCLPNISKAAPRRRLRACQIGGGNLLFAGEQAAVPSRILPVIQILEVSVRTVRKAFHPAKLLMRLPRSPRRADEKEASSSR